jgi:O-methyltransferase
MSENGFKTWLRRSGLHGLDRRLKKALGVHKRRMSHPPYGPDVDRRVRAHIDIVRYSTIALAVERIHSEEIPGDFAELGVFKGELSAFLAAIAQGRTLHLFDTFAGFPEGDLEPGEQADSRFTDTSVDAVRQRIGDCSNVVFHEGPFPDTAGPVMDRKFSFVMLDPDKYKPTYAGLEIFYPRLSQGGYLFMHDFNNPESDFAVSRAAHDFFKDKPEFVVEIPDANGSALIRKI